MPCKKSIRDLACCLFLAVCFVPTLGFTTGVNNKDHKDDRDNRDDKDKKDKKDDRDDKDKKDKKDDRDDKDKKDKKDDRDDKDKKVQVCHKPGQPGYPAGTITISSNAVAAHLAHGDTVGPCVIVGGCDDSIACTIDSTNPDGSCNHIPAPAVCADTNACTTETCNPASGCVYTDVSCIDGNPCTAESCNPASGCIYPPAGCTDTDPCTTSECTAEGGCVHTSVTCADDGDRCNGVEVCDPDTGGCHSINEPICDDGSACTIDYCDPVIECQTRPVVGDCCNSDADCGLDNDVCNGVETCEHNACTNPPDVDCDDGLACTTDSCNPSTGVCSRTPVTCSDNNVCTTDDCSEGPAGYICSNTELPPLECCNVDTDCSDNIECTDGTCVGNECQFNFDDTNTCTDSNECTLNDHCINDGSSGIQCVGDAVVCPPSSDACHNKVCNQTNGECEDIIIANEEEVTCDDGLACTTGDVCTGGVCAGPNTVPNCCSIYNPCVSNNPCIDSACVNGACQQTNNTASCNDNNPCTDVDTCGDGICQGSPKVCTPPNSCHTEDCDVGTGECIYPPKSDGTTCDDLNACTDPDICTGGTCGGQSICAPVCGNSVVDSGEQCDEGDQLSGDGCSATCQREARRAFMTSTTYNGNLVAAANNDSSYCDSRGSLVGVAAADCLCQSRASSRVIGTQKVLACPGGGFDCWKAWISDANPSSAPASRFIMASTNSTLPIHQVNVNGTPNTNYPIAVFGWPDLIVCSGPGELPGACLDDVSLTTNGQTWFNESGVSILTPAIKPTVYTNTNVNGTQVSATSTCSNWTMATPDDGVSIGYSYDYDHSWTNEGISQPCNAESALYCFEDFGPPIQCGNGITETGETCDDGDTDSGDGCSATCHIEEPVCGNGFTEEGETCDDGNTVAGDGCSAACQTEAVAEYRRAFMTSTKYTGDLVTAANSDSSYCTGIRSFSGDYNIQDGVNAADCLCQSRASAASLTCPAGSGGGFACWKAWISDGSFYNYPANRFNMRFSPGDAIPIYQVDSSGAANFAAPIALGGWADLVVCSNGESAGVCLDDPGLTGTLTGRTWFNEYGDPSATKPTVYTNTKVDGTTTGTSFDVSCYNWTTTIRGGRIGLSDNNGRSWTNPAPQTTFPFNDPGLQFCTVASSLYCFEDF